MTRKLSHVAALDCDAIIRQGLARLPVTLLEDRLTALEAVDLARATKRDREHVWHTTELVRDALYAAKHQEQMRIMLAVAGTAKAARENLPTVLAGMERA